MRQASSRCGSTRSPIGIRSAIVSVDGQTSHSAESALFRYLLQRRMPGEKIPVTVLRDGERMNLELLMQ